MRRERLPLQMLQIFDLLVYWTINSTGLFLSSIQEPERTGIGISCCTECVSISVTLGMMLFISVGVIYFDTITYYDSVVVPT